MTRATEELPTIRRKVETYLDFLRRVATADSGPAADLLISADIAKVSGSVIACMVKETRARQLPVLRRVEDTGPLPVPLPRLGRERREAELNELLMLFRGH